MTPADIDRLAHVAASLRPDWPLQSLRTMLTNFAHSQPHRSYPDTAHALVEIALDEKTRNPGRLAEAGPWWHARPGAEPERKITMGTDVVICPKCRRIDFPDEGHDCKPHLSSPEARAAAKIVAAEARGRYERVMGERVEAMLRGAAEQAARGECGHTDEPAEITGCPVCLARQACAADLKAGL